jgi:hypothetical protein
MSALNVLNKAKEAEKIKRPLVDTDTNRYLNYLLYWYKSTNTGAEDQAPARRCRQQVLNLLAILVQKYTYACLLALLVQKHKY